MILDMIPILLFVVILVLLFLMRNQLASIEGNQDDQDEVNSLREEISRSEQGIKEEIRSSQRTVSETLTTQFQSTGEMLGAHLTEVGNAQTRELENVTKSTNTLTQSNESRIENVRKTVDERIQALQASNEKSLNQIRQTVTEQLTATADTLVSTVGELGNAQKTATEMLVNTISELGDTQQQRLEDVTKSTNTLMQSNEASIENVRKTVDSRLQTMQDSNERKLDEMRKTVDEQLQSTLEKRLTESFNVVNENLKAVQEGVGKMQKLAADVGDLQRVLTNVSTRGAWGEVQLGAILEQILTPDQYAQNVQPHTGTERVEYAVRLPGNDDNPDTYIWLPIDSKFPTADYQRIIDAAEIADKKAEQSATRSLIRTVQSQASDIYTKYVSPPHTTNFAIMFLPTEGLYAEVLRQPGLVEELLQTHRIVVAGPTTLTAILLGLRVGFKTLAIQEHSGKILDMLSAVKTEFGEYSKALDLTQRHLRRASNTLEKTEKRSQAVVGKLRDVEELPIGKAAKKLGLPETELGNELFGETDTNTSSD